MSVAKKSTRLAAALVGLARLPSIFWAFSRLGYQRKALRSDDSVLDFRGKTIVITGANSGIGRAAAEAIITRGGALWLLCRNRERGQEALEFLQGRAALGGSAQLVVVDMSDLAAVRRAADAISDSKIDGLIHNAGTLNHERQLTREGLELDFALHLAGPHLLTRLLLPRLQRAGGRVVFVSSGGMYSERLSEPAMHWANRPYDGVQAYAQVKRGQVALAELWSQKIPDVRFHAMHPGWVDTPGVATSLPRFYRLSRPYLRTPEQGADTMVYLVGAATLPGDSGTLYFDRQVVSPYMLPGTRESPEDRDALWKAVEAVTS